MSAKPLILLVGNESPEREALIQLLRAELYGVLLAEKAEEALAHVSQPVDVVVSDVRLGEASGVELLRRWKQQRPETPVLFVATRGDVSTAVEGMKLGAEGYVSTPVNRDELMVMVSKCLESRRKNERIRQLEARLDGQSGIDIPAGTSLEELEHVAVMKALEVHDGNRTRAAGSLGISVRTLQRKLKAWAVNGNGAVDGNGTRHRNHGSVAVNGNGTANGAVNGNVALIGNGEAPSYEPAVCGVGDGR